MPARKDDGAAVLDTPEGDLPVRQPETAKMPRLILPLGRGKCGKTTFVRWAAERAQLAGRSVVLGDADRTNPELAGYFTHVTQPASASDNAVRDYVAAFVEALIETPPERRCTGFIDFGGGDQVLKAVAREIELVGFLESNGIEPVALHFIGPDLEDLAYVRDVEETRTFAPSRMVLVLNEALTPAGKDTKTAFRPVVEHAIFRDAAARGKVVWMPRLACMQEINLRQIGFAAAEEGRVKDGQAKIGPWARQQIAIWRRAMEAGFADVADWLA